MTDKLSPVPIEERLKRLSLFLWQQRGKHFVFIQDEGDPYLARKVWGFSDWSVVEVQIEFIEGKYDIWLRALSLTPAVNKPNQRGYHSEVLAEHLIAKVDADADLVWAVIDSFTQRHSTGDDFLDLLDIGEELTSKSGVTREWGLGDNLIEHDPETGEHLVKIPPGDGHALLILGTEGQQCAGVDFFEDRIEFGHWTMDGEWIQLAAVDTRGKRIYL